MTKKLIIINTDRKIKLLQSKNNKIVLCHGVFDVLHSGHILHFQKAKSLGNKLIVSVTADEFIKKGPGRPYFNLQQRMKMISELTLVDLVIPSYEVTSVSNILKIKPIFYCKGIDYKDTKSDITNNIIKERNAIKKVGGEIVYTDTKKYSASNLLKSEFNMLTPVQNTFLNKITKITKINLINYFKKIESLKVLVLGEIIIDKYTYGNAVGKSSKDPIIVLNHTKTQSYLGGAGSIARNVSSFSKNVHLLSSLEDKSTENNFIKKNLTNSLKLVDLKKKNFKTIVKRRFVDEVSRRKLLGLYDLNDDEMDKKNELKVINYLKKNSKNFDIIIVADYGHGFVTSKIAKTLTENYKLCFVNSQINSFNIRSQSLDKYDGSFCIVINESELRIDLKDTQNEIKKLVKKFFKKYNIQILVVTSGSLGATIFYKNSSKSVNCPAFGNDIVDKTGSGDSLLALFSICIASGISDEMSLLIGSLAAADSLQFMANSKLIDKNTLIKSIENLTS